MSKNRNNYGSFYKPQPKEVSNEKIEEAIVKEEVAEALMEETPEEESKVEEPVILKVTNTKRVNFRKAPNKDATILSVLSEGNEVEMINKPSPEWYKVKVNDKVGFIMAQYLK